MNDWFPLRVVLSVGLCVLWWSVPACGRDHLRAVLLLPTEFKVYPGDSLEWSDPAFNDSQWERVPVPLPIEKRFVGSNGHYWYRVEFDTPTGDVKDMAVSLGKIGDVDETFVNGVSIGGTGRFFPNGRSAYHRWRVYRIPETLLHRGHPNSLAIRCQKVYDLHAGMYAGTVGLGSYEGFRQLARRNYFLTTELGVFFALFSFIMGFYHLFLFFRIPEKKTNLIYFFFALASAFFMLSLSFKTTEWLGSPRLLTGA